MPQVSPLAPSSITPTCSPAIGSRISTRCSRSPNRRGSPATNGADVAADILLDILRMTAPTATPEPGWEPVEPFPSPQDTFLADGDRVRLAYFRKPGEPDLVCESLVRSQDDGPAGHVHGGAMAATLDEAMGAVCWMNGHKVVAADDHDQLPGDVADRDRNNRSSNDRSGRRPQSPFALDADRSFRPEDHRRQRPLHRPQGRNSQLPRYVDVYVERPLILIVLRTARNVLASGLRMGANTYRELGVLAACRRIAAKNHRNYCTRLRVAQRFQILQSDQATRLCQAPRTSPRASPGARPRLRAVPDHRKGLTRRNSSPAQSRTQIAATSIRRLSWNC